MTKKSQNIIFNHVKRFSLLVIFSFFLVSCIKFKSSEPISGPEKARKNIEEGRGVSIGNAVKGIRGGTTTYEFSTANPMWRASLETLDFLPLTTVDYSGGIIITDWYFDTNSNTEESIKIAVRFLSNDIRSESVKITVHQRICKSSGNCKIQLLNNSNIQEELHRAILKKASLMDKDKKNKKK
jgi:hypothetical protein